MRHSLLALALIAALSACGKTEAPGPAAPAGTTAVICVALTTVYEAAFTAPNFTAVTPTNPLPVRVTVFPPEAGPWAGETADTTGATA